MANAVKRFIISAEIPFANCGRKNFDVCLADVDFIRDIDIYRAKHHVGRITGPSAHIGPRFDNL